MQFSSGDIGAPAPGPVGRDNSRSAGSEKADTGSVLSPGYNGITKDSSRMQGRDFNQQGERKDDSMKPPAPQINKVVIFT